MSRKPTSASVTDVECTCSYLSSSADDPLVPINFDPLTGEYHFQYAGGCMLVIYHCPFCGGAAPESKRHLLFAVISPEEESRLAELLTPLQSIADAREKLGEPDFESDSGQTVFHPETDEAAPTKEHFRTLLYEKLSPLADVHLTERADGRVHYSLVGKYIGPREEPPTSS